MIRKLHKSISSTVMDRDALREEIASQHKSLAQLRDKVYKAKSEMDSFYVRANRSMMSSKV